MARVDFTPQSGRAWTSASRRQHLVRLVAATGIEVAAMDIRRSDMRRTRVVHLIGDSSAL